MKSIIRNVIESRSFELSDILKKLDRLWLEGAVSDEERSELAELARGNADMDKGYAAQEERFRRLEERVKALEDAVKADSGQDAPAEEYPAWVQPTGAHDAYYTGAKMTFTDGKRYICTAPEGYAVTYGPDVLPGYWQQANFA